MPCRNDALLWARAGLAGCLGLPLACGSADDHDAQQLTMTSPTSSGDDTTSASADDSGSADSTASGGSEGTGNCGNTMCAGHGACEMNDEGMAVCVCDEFYELNDAGNECVVDEDCIKVRYLEDKCRQLFDSAPAVSLFFAVDFCAGTAVLPEDRERLGIEFLVLEEDEDIAENVESYSTIIPKDVESYVTLSIDVSKSLTMDDDLSALVPELRAFVQGLAPGAEDPPVYVSVDVIARDVAEYVPFTRDLADVDSKLAAIAEDPAAIQLLAGGEDGTDLYDAVELAIQRTQRARDLRDAVTWGGVLTTGTVVVVTDGNDSSNGMLDTALITATTNQVISVGISDEIEDADLQAIGRDGSFLAPEAENWADTFAEIRQRVDQYPDRSYFLAYCSSLTEGNPQVVVKARNSAGDVFEGAACGFFPNYFGVDPLDTCTPELFMNECTNGLECGGITACGACADGECCDSFTCVAPQSATDLEVSCDDQYELCYVDGQICPPMSTTCEPAAGLGDACADDNPCEPGVGFCGGVTSVCEPTMGLGEPCGEEWEQCASQHCDRTNPDAPLDIKVCQSPAEIYDSCGDKLGTCELGAYCKGTECAPRLRRIESCGEGEQCRSGECIEIESGGKICSTRLGCFWSWDQKFPN